MMRPGSPPHRYEIEPLLHGCPLLLTHNGRVLALVSLPVVRDGSGVEHIRQQPDQGHPAKRPAGMKPLEPSACWPVSALSRVSPISDDRSGLKQQLLPQ